MSETAAKISEVLQAFHRFEDGLLLSFEFSYAPGERLAAQILFHARDHRLDGNVWKRVKVVVRRVEELSANVSGHQFNSIQFNLLGGSIVENRRVLVCRY
ncbi:hypothetical protein [Pseudomonas protegens]|uniref:hypothetical protein n=1 Tax=Pseudomonas protegens TaxID=380021 RepID=UPI0015E75257|nr:hypothetical protein [Pseudomonas protegens]